jgi:putative flippase GtrA
MRSSTVQVMRHVPADSESTGVGRVRTFVRTLRTPDSGVLGQGVRFALSGGTVALVYLGATTVLAEVVGMPFQAALAIGFSLGLVVHFTLQRLFVWTHHEEFALPLGHQIGRYLLAAAVQYGVTAASTGLLPSALDVSAEIVYLATVAVVLSSNFLVFRYGIFHAKAGDGDRETLGLVSEGSGATPRADKAPSLPPL